MSIFIFLKLIGSLALLMYGMKTMSEALQKLTGGQLRHFLGAMTTNRFTGLLTGAFVTASVQSSTATTVMTVSFVNAGLLTLAQAISVIMGANIGTTVTAWIMSVFGFQIDMNNLIFPLFALAVPLIFSNKSQKKSFGEFIFGFALEFLGLNDRALVTENDLEQSILDNLQRFLLEMGHGFCFEARQKRILIDGDYFFADLVFYHRILKCHVIVELKIDKFRHEYASQLNLYLNYFKAEVMQPDDNPPVGILLCTEKGDTLVKYATAGLDPNIFVQKYMIELPTEEEIKKFISTANY